MDMKYIIIILMLLIIVPIAIICTVNGIELCKKNDGIGLFFLFLGLSFLGLILGVGLLYNARNGMYEMKQDAVVIDEQINPKIMNTKPYGGSQRQE